MQQFPCSSWTECILKLHTIALVDEAQSDKSYMLTSENSLQRAKGVLEVVWNIKKSLTQGSQEVINVKSTILTAIFAFEV